MVKTWPTFAAVRLDVNAFWMIGERVSESEGAYERVKNESKEKEKEK